MDMYNFASTNTFDICWQVVMRNKLSVNKDTIHKQFAEHPYQDSLMAITDILAEYNIVASSYSIEDVDTLANCDKPYIALVFINFEPYFTIIDSVINETVIWYNPIKKKRESISFEYFKEIFGGIITYVDIKNYIEETDYRDNKRKSFLKRCIESIPVLAIIIALVSVLFSFVLSGPSIFFVLYVVGLVIGTIICTILLNYEVNDYKSTLVEKLCPAGKKWDCSTILTSSANSIYGISWSTIGLAYYAGTLITLVCAGIGNMDYYRTAAFINLFALPYIIYSLYYQIVVSKHWCVMCLSVIVFLIYLFVVSCLGGFLSFDLKTIICSLPAFIIIDLGVLWGSNVYISLNTKNKSYNELFPAFNKLRHKECVFNALLEETPLIADVPLNMSINVGQSAASVKLLKVCDPFCTACSKSQIKLEKTLEDKDVFLQVIFTIFPTDNETKRNVIKLFFALKEKYGDDYMKQVLHDWYSQEHKDYKEFRNRFEIESKAIDAQENVIVWMEQKTQELEIQYTPTFFINNHQLPDDFYSYNDFKSLFA